MQGRPSISKQQAEITGGTINHSGNYAKRGEHAPISKKSLGDPTKCMKLDEIIVWNELCERFVLTERDRYIVEQTCELIAKRRTDGLENKEHNLLLRLLTNLGATPASRQRVIEPPKEDGDDEFGKLFQ